MKNINNLRLPSRAGQIAPIAIIIGALILGGVGGIFYFSLKKPSTPVIPQTNTGCSALNPEQCAADELAKNLAAEKAAQDALGPLSDAVADNANMKDPQAVAESFGYTKIADLPSQKKIGGETLTVAVGSENYQFSIVNWVKSAFNRISDYISNWSTGIFNILAPPLPDLSPIDLDSVPSSPAQTPTVPVPTKPVAPAPAPTPMPTGVQGYIRVQIINGTGYEIGLDEDIAVSDIYGFTTAFQYPSGELLYRISYDRQAAAVTIDITQTKPDSCLLALSVHGTEPVKPGTTLTYIARGTLTGTFTYADDCRNSTELPTRPVTGTFTVSARR